MAKTVHSGDRGYASVNGSPQYDNSQPGNQNIKGSKSGKKNSDKIVTAVAAATANPTLDAKVDMTIH
jgi:hypothetical protein